MGCLPTGENGEAAANGNAIYRGDAGLCVRTGRAGRERTRCGHTGAHGIVAPTTAAAIGEDTFYPAYQRLRVLDRAKRPIQVNI